MMMARCLLALVVILVAGCAGVVNLPEPSFVAPPPIDQVESVIFLVGDPGEAPLGASPLMARLKEDVAYWSEQLEGDSAVSVLYLGDIVYPLGMRAPGTPGFSEDSLMVMGQVDVLASPSARERAHGYFLSGNHDWGLEEDWNGFLRIQRLSEFLTRASEVAGASVRFVPDPGSGGPYVVDVGAHIRLVMIDTAWWILDGGRLGLDSRRLVLDGVREALEDAGNRDVIVVGHHPFQSAGPHGGQFSFWRTLGVRYLLVRSGAMLQDITSIPYRELADGLREIFADTEAPLLFAGGHEHSLQVFRGVRPTDPEFSVVSGSASKLSAVGSKPGMQFGRSAPGYMRVLVERGGGITLSVESTPEEYLTCPLQEPQRTTCMSEGVAAFETVHSQRLQ